MKELIICLTEKEFARNIKEQRGNYWYVGSPIWCAYFKLIKYNTGDMVWISKLTGKGVCGITHDGVSWNTVGGKPPVDPETVLLFNKGKITNEI